MGIIYIYIYIFRVLKQNPGKNAGPGFVVVFFSLALLFVGLLGVFVGFFRQIQVVILATGSRLATSCLQVARSSFDFL